MDARATEDVYNIKDRVDTPFELLCSRIMVRMRGGCTFPLYCRQLID